MTIKDHVHNGRYYTTNKIEENEFKTSERILNVVTEYPQIPHITNKVDKSSMKEQVTQEREIGIQDGGAIYGGKMGNLERDDAEMENEVV